MFLGIAVSPDGRIYLADGPNIRMVDQNGIISTVIGHQYHRYGQSPSSLSVQSPANASSFRSTWRPMPCSGAIPAKDVQLNWPTELALSPLDNTLHFIDDNVVLKMTRDGRVSVVVGRPPHCPPDKDGGVSLVEPQSLSFAPNGDLFVAESDSQRINRIRRVSTDGRVELYAGGESK